MRMVHNDDGSVTIGLTKNREVVLPEPSMPQLAKMYTLVRAADNDLAALKQVTKDSSADELAEAVKILNERADKMYSDASPHGNAWLAIIAMLTDDSDKVTAEDLPGSLMNPKAINQLLSWFSTPLPGESEPSAAT